jgi:hypothetical protein
MRQMKGAMPLMLGSRPCTSVRGCVDASPIRQDRSPQPDCRDRCRYQVVSLAPRASCLEAFCLRLWPPRYPLNVDRSSHLSMSAADRSAQSQCSRAVGTRTGIVCQSSDTSARHPLTVEGQPHASAIGEPYAGACGVHFSTGLHDANQCIGDSQRQPSRTRSGIE